MLTRESADWSAKRLKSVIGKENIFSMKDKDSPYFMIQSVDRTLQILELFVTERKPLGIKDIAERVKLHKSVVHRMLATLQAHNFVEQNPESSKYQIGLKAFEVGSVYMNTTNLITEGRKLIIDLVDQLGFSTHMAILNEGTVFYLVNQEPPNKMRIQPPMALRAHIYNTALGKCLTAWMEPDKVIELLEKQKFNSSHMTEKTHTEPATFLAELQTVRERGYALDDEEGQIGYRCLGVPIRDHTREVVAALSVTATTGELTYENIGKQAEVLKKYAYAISQRLGFSVRSTVY